MGNSINLEINTKGAEASLEAVGQRMDGLQKQLDRLGKAITASFAAWAAGDCIAGAVKASGVLSKELLVLRLALGKLRVAVGEAVAPIGEVFIPMLSKAVFALIRFVRYIGGIIGALLGTSDATDTAADSMASAAAAAGKAARTLAGFDQINRLDSGSASGSTQTAQTLQAESQALDLWQRLIVSKIQSLLAPLQAIDFTGAIRAFGKLKEAVAPITRALFAGLEWVWFNILVPLAAWVIEDALPVFLAVLAKALHTLNTVIEAVKPHLTWLWENYLQPLAQWAGEKVLEALAQLKQKLQGVSTWISENQELVRGMTVIAAAFLAVWAGSQVASWLGQSQGLTGFFSGLGKLILTVIGIVTALGAAFGQLWRDIQSAFSGVGQWFKGVVNGILGFINQMIAGVISGINGMVRALNTVRFAVPDWVPVLGGESFGLGLKTVTAPQIPYLARGAVLPANRPFLAMVGDQKHGTNVEAPLATIQEAVAVVMEDQTSAILAGFEASIGVQREILEAILGIRIGDAVIAQAAERYQRKMAVVRGGHV